MTWLNAGAGMYPAPPPWLNIEHGLQGSPEIRADLLHLPITSASIERIYCGHVLEHIDWYLIPHVMTELRRVLTPEGEVCVVGPDVFTAIHRWKLGFEPWEVVTEAVESWHNFQPIDTNYARHRWNASQRRVVEVMRRAGFHRVRPVRLATAAKRWPLVSMARWQCAVEAVAP